MAGPLPGPDCLRNVGEARAVETFGKTSRDAARDSRPLVDHRRIELDEASTGADPLPRVVGGRNPADADQRHLAARGSAKFAQRLERQRLERLARKAASLVAVARLEQRPRNGRVGNDDRIDLVLDGDANDLVRLARSEE